MPEIFLKVESERLDQWFLTFHLPRLT